MKKLHVNLPENAYDILIERGCLAQSGQWAAELWRPQKIVIITDNHVGELYAETVKLSLESAGFAEVKVFAFLEGEASKNLTTVETAYKFLADFGMTRSDGIVALGGGVVGDLAGFVASTYMRGIHFLQIATSLTAQVDSSVGGKTGVNTAYAKNMVGTFTQPDGVLIDPECLKTLGERELYEGMGEVIKCGLIADTRLWALLQEMSGDVASVLDNAEALIYHSCDVKRKVVVEDELDNGTRLYLNFGHTIGHAVEATAGYGKVMHGEGVAIGMIQITKIAEEKGLVALGLTDKIRAMVEKFHLPTTYEPWHIDVLAKTMTLDKKARGTKIKTVLVPKIGQAVINEINMSDVPEWLG
ncbi:3-dehydroquinate synthase [Lactococcus hodotermopsidis]|uniref:3-dehydroquinate synthase n=1 Tax=Pseudolactococcus hodotermopsidis TaxID=2709157 RepID=A0A6A0BDI5_9LACT|nr:3-dehydroquinate synthase [Lactococcus hodotermopsidis]GFH41887.1 3-dehydroquinate synthase [Lactococcus hodotermopsidis]